MLLHAPDTPISAKRVRQLLGIDPTLTPDFLKENKVVVDELIASVFERVTGQINAEAEEGEALQEASPDTELARKLPARSVDVDK